MSVHITPRESQTEGVVTSALAGLLATTIISGASILIFQDTTLAKIAFLPAGMLTGLGYYYLGLFQVGFQRVAVQLSTGEPTGRLYINGDHWRRRPWRRALETPGPTQFFVLDMPKNVPEGKDTVKIYIGEKDPAKIRIMVFDPFRYIGDDDPEHTVMGAYGNQVRTFVNQMDYGLGLLEDKSLLEEYLEIPPHPSHDIYHTVGYHLDDAERQKRIERHDKLRARLEALTIHRRNEETGQIDACKVFGPTAVDAVMDRAGRFMEELWESGIHPEKVFAPSIDPSVAIDEAADEKERQRHKNEVLQMQVRAQKRLAKELKDDLEVPGEDALDRVGLNVPGQNIKRNVFGLSGGRDTVLDAIRLLAELTRGGPTVPPATPPAPPPPQQPQP